MFVYIFSLAVLTSEQQNACQCLCFNLLLFILLAMFMDRSINYNEARVSHYQPVVGDAAVRVQQDIHQCQILCARRLW